mmetsp:Transcript_43357/g.72197  ORF Transcript_43357/g.72197 Transcript_43357/m.72197 type:complete len:170 (+) Transcript_43357:1980-2489(+)
MRGGEEVETTPEWRSFHGFCCGCGSDFSFAFLSACQPENGICVEGGVEDEEGNAEANGTVRQIESGKGEGGKDEVEKVEGENDSGCDYHFRLVAQEICLFVVFVDLLLFDQEISYLACFFGLYPGIAHCVEEAGHWAHSARLGLGVCDLSQFSHGAPFQCLALSSSRHA